MFLKKKKVHVNTTEINGVSFRLFSPYVHFPSFFNVRSRCGKCKKELKAKGRGGEEQDTFSNCLHFCTPLWQHECLNAKTRSEGLQALQAPNDFCSTTLLNGTIFLHAVHRYPLHAPSYVCIAPEKHRLREPSLSNAKCFFRATKTTAPQRFISSILSSKRNTSLMWYLIVFWTRITYMNRAISVLEGTN